VRIFRCIAKIRQGVCNEAANSHYGQQRVDVTKGKVDKKILGNNSYLISFELFLMLCKQKWTAVK
jgi:hypothetical protein